MYGWERRRKKVQDAYGKEKIIAKYWRVHILWRPFVTYSWIGGGRMDGGVGRSKEGEAGVMNSWPIPSRMPSNLCYKKEHPSNRQATVLYTNAQALKHIPRLHKGNRDHSQRLLCITLQTLLLLHSQMFQWNFLLLIDAIMTQQWFLLYCVFNVGQFFVLNLFF